MTEDKISQAINSFIPKSLDDIVRMNREQLQLRLATPAELNAIDRTLVVPNLKGTIREAFIYNRVGPEIKQPILCLVGFDEYGDAYHTSNLLAFDHKNNTVLTATGSYYLIANFTDGKPDFLLLAHICFMLHHAGIGDYFGVPEFFY